MLTPLNGPMDNMACSCLLPIREAIQKIQIEHPDYDQYFFSTIVDRFWQSDVNIDNAYTKARKAQFVQGYYQLPNKDNEFPF